MDINTAIYYLKNAGFHFKIPMHDGTNMFLEDPACISRTFDIFFEKAWIIATLITAMLLFGWGIAAIRDHKNGALSVISRNFKNLFMIFCIFSAVHPIINFIWGDDLFAKACKTYTISIGQINTILDESGFTGHGTDGYLEMGLVSSKDERLVSGEQTRTNYAYETNEGAVVYTDNDGVAHYRTGNIPRRNYNPGQIKNADNTEYQGVVGIDNDEYLIFDTLANGWLAFKTWITSDKFYNNPIKDVLLMYTGDVAEDADAFAEYIKDQTDIDASTLIRALNDTEIQDVMEAIAKKDGWK